MAAKSRSAKFYASHPSSRAKKQAYDRVLGARPAQVTKREESNKARYNAKKNGKDIRGLDWDHSVHRFVKSSTNRGRTSGTAGDNRARNRHVRFGGKS